MARKKINAVRIKIDGIKDIEQRLLSVGLTPKSDETVRIMQQGAKILDARITLRAPRRTGRLQSGVVTASQLSNEYRQLTRKGKSISSNLRYPPRPGQVLVWESVFYGTFVERGRKRGSRSGYQRRRLYFRAAAREAKPTVQAFILRRLEKLIEQRWNAGYTRLDAR